MSNNHSHACSCGHTHPAPKQTHACSCGHHHAAILCEDLNLTAEEQTLLALFTHYPYLPVTRFVLRSTDTDIESIALAPVVINDQSDTMAQVKEMAAHLVSLAEKGLISLDYDIPIADYDYEGYRTSSLFAYFEQTVAESKGKPGFLFDTAALEGGSMALTERGLSLFQQ